MRCWQLSKRLLDYVFEIMSDNETLGVQRLDQRVISKTPKLSRRFASHLIKNGKVAVNGRVVNKPGHKIHITDKVKIDFKPSDYKQITDINLPIIYDDNNCIVINKPAGVLSHSKGEFSTEATVATWLHNKINTNLGDGRGGIVHRLDRATSGVMICAKKTTASIWLKKQFSQRHVNKYYYAVITGHLPHNHAFINMPILRNPKKPQTFYTTASGKSAITEYWVRDQNQEFSLLELKPQTGRTHQLRVHLKAIGHPIVGDTVYGGKKADRLYLHSWKLSIILPNRIEKTFSASPPKEFNTKIKS